MRKIMIAASVLTAAALTFAACGSSSSDGGASVEKTADGYTISVSVNKDTGEITVPNVESGSDVGTDVGFGVVKIDVPKDDEITFTLSSNSSTGYSWYETKSSDVLEETDNSVVDTSADSNDELVGQPDQTVISFRAAKAGDASVTYTYGQDWDGGEKARDLTITLTVNEDADGNPVIDKQSVKLAYSDT